MKVGFVGYGAQAQENLVPCCQTLPGVEVAAVCDGRADRRAEARRILAIDRIYADHQTMLDACALDALVVACYPTDHHAIAMAAMERGLPVFVEKPPAPSSAHLRSMIELAARTGCVTGVGMNFRFAAVTRRLKMLAADGLESMTLRHFCNKPVQPIWNETGLLRSFLYAQTIHSVDFLIDLFGPVGEVTVFGEMRGASIIMTVVLCFRNGGNASLITSNTCPHFVFDFDAICRNMRHVSSSSLWSLGVTEVGKPYQDGETKRWSDHWAHSPLDSGFVRSGYAGQMGEFFAAIRERRASSISFASLAETYRCLDSIEAQMDRELTVLTRKAS